MILQKNYSLRTLNTFKVEAKARFFRRVRTTDEARLSVNEVKGNHQILVLGEGANLLFTKDVDGLIIKNEIKGRQVVKDSRNSVTLRVGSGENWHETVMWTAENGWSGIENLAYIPGTVGAAPVQNIAAYGQNFEDVLNLVEGIFTDSGQTEIFHKEECQLAYRESIFKKGLRNKFFVTAVEFTLSKKPQSETSYHSRYESIASELQRFGQGPYKPIEIAQATISLRKKKLPDWHQLGTAGSFFKNPVVTKEKFQELTKLVTNLQSYPASKLVYLKDNDPGFGQADQVKIPAGRLLDELGWRGKRIGNVGTFERQALAVVNYGGATGKEILDFADKMRGDVLKNYGISLEREVVVI